MTKKLSAVDETSSSSGDSDDDAVPSKVEGKDSDRAGRIIQASLVVALVWWGFGLYTVLTTRSLAVLASLVDATIDLAAQGILLCANRMGENDSLKEEYPVGFAARLEPIGVICCAVLMVIGSIGVIVDSTFTIYRFYPEGPDMEFSDIASCGLAIVVVVKIIVWRIAKAEYDRTQNVSLEALALDNFNDILSNASAFVFASLTRFRHDIWWTDPIGGILISLYIIRSWYLTAQEQTQMLIGRAADKDFITKVFDMAAQHDNHIQEVTNVRAYHLGPQCLVEIDLIMDRTTPLEDVHDVGVTLQDQVERLDECERCFVHIDYKQRDVQLHDTNVPIIDKIRTAPLKPRARSSSLRLRHALTMTGRSGSFASIKE